MLKIRSFKPKLKFQARNKALLDGELFPTSEDLVNYFCCQANFVFCIVVLKHRYALLKI